METRMAGNGTILEPGAYSVFVLLDDQTWEQPTYIVRHRIPEVDFRMAAELDCDGFISYGVGEDPDCPIELLRELPGLADLPVECQGPLHDENMCSCYTVEIEALTRPYPWESK